MVIQKITLILLSMAFHPRLLIITKIRQGFVSLFMDTLQFNLLHRLKRNFIIVLIYLSFLFQNKLGRGNSFDG